MLWYFTVRQRVIFKTAVPVSNCLQDDAPSCLTDLCSGWFHRRSSSVTCGIGNQSGTVHPNSHWPTQHRLSAVQEHGSDCLQHFVHRKYCARSSVGWRRTCSCTSLVLNLLTDNAGRENAGHAISSLWMALVFKCYVRENRFWMWNWGGGDADVQW